MDLFTKKELHKIEQAVHRAEKKTAGEIVPIVVPTALPAWIVKILPQHMISFYTHYRARKYFYEQGIHRTAGKTGIIIAVFLQERRVEVVADKGISTHYPQKTWEELVTLIVAAAKAADLTTGLCQAIEHCGAILAEYCPIQKNDRNELSNNLRILR